MKKESELNLSDFEGFELIRAFVTFDNYEDIRKLLLNFKKEYSNGFCMCLIKKEKNEKYYFKGRKLKIKIPDIPSNINWENIGYSICKRLFRIFLVIIFISIILVIGTILILGFTSFRESNKEMLKYIGSDCFKKMSLTKYQSYNDPDYETTYCFCSLQDKITILNNSSIKDICYDYLQDIIKLNLMKFLGSFLISIIDILFAVLINKIIRFVRFLHNNF